MRAILRCAIIVLLAVMLASCAWQPTQLDHAHALSEMADKAANDGAKCQSSGAALGSQAYTQCRALLQDKMSIENGVPPDRGYPDTRGRN
jgi:starvation-inducible outer membrane lipoprotein